MDRDTFTQTLLFTGYKDYSAARLLLNNVTIIQGLTLASSAVEKYIKAYLVAVGKKPRQVHLNNFKELKKQFGQTHLGILEKLDEGFLTLLGKAYDYRYWDYKTEIEYIGFPILQVLGELDFTINLFESTLETFDKESGQVIDNWYWQAYNEKQKILTENNYLFQDLSKDEFMAQSMCIYSLRINPQKPNEQLVLELFLDDQQVNYDGKINTGTWIRKKGMKDFWNGDND